MNLTQFVRIINPKESIKCIKYDGERVVVNKEITWKFISHKRGERITFHKYILNKDN